MPMGSMTRDRKEKLDREAATLLEQVGELRDTDPRRLWLRDLERLEAAILEDPDFIKGQ
jgi:hypothetical protein